MEMKIMLSGALVLAGFLWSYLFLRQFLFNVRVAYPLIKKMNSLQPELIGVGAKRYTLISNLVSILVGGAICFAVLYFCPLYIKISFAVGALAAFLFIFFRTKPENKESFDLFSNAYYRFIPDDELRTLLFNKEYKKIKGRLKDMGIQGSFVPDFKLLSDKK